MRPTAAASIPATIKLRAGQTYRLWAGRQAVLLVQAGHAHLRAAPSWLDEILLDWQSTLQEGQHCLLERSGWLYIEARKESELLYYAAPALGHFSFALLYRIRAGPLRRRLRLFWRKAIP